MKQSISFTQSPFSRITRIDNFAEILYLCMSNYKCTKNRNMFLNLCNHPSSQWSESQLFAAKEYGEIIDLPFPYIDPGASEADIAVLADSFFLRVKSMGEAENITIHLMGEFSFTYALLYRLRKEGYDCVVSTSARNVVMRDGVKEVVFDFVRFRKII